MADNMAKLTIVGNLGRDAETRFTRSGKSVTKTSVAVNERWKQDGAQKSRTTGYEILIPRTPAGDATFLQ